MIEIRMAAIEDIPRIMKFIDEHWKKGHILSKNRKLFDWMHVEGDQCNFAIAYDPLEDKIYGIQGFIKYNEEERPDVSGAIWKTIKCKDNPMLGLEIDKFMTKTVNYRMINSPGLSEKAMRLAELQGGKRGELYHYYRLHDRESYSIAEVKKKVIPAAKTGGSRFREIMEFREFDQCISQEALEAKTFLKSKKYYQHRYFQHPIYHYQFYGIEDKGMVRSILIGREVKAQGSKILRFVDFAGIDEDLSNISEALDQLMEQKGYEYVDFYCYGIEDAILKHGGFCRKDKNDSNIIPDYFEPFERRNVSIHFILPEEKNFHMYKGDGDQDRPNMDQ